MIWKAEPEDCRALLCLFGARMAGHFLYSWGGESSEEGGYDCSGMISTVLAQTCRFWPALYDGQRRTAQGLRDYFIARGCTELKGDPEQLRPGCLVFYARPGHAIHHVALHLCTVPLGVGPVALEAGGGGSRTTSPREALLASAGVRLTASDQHGQGVTWTAVDPIEVLG